MNKVPNSTSLYRYTSIPVLLDMLQNDRLFLSNPDNWKDKTDAHFLKEHSKSKIVKALCFFEKNETSHYWELYAKQGCMITFNTKLLLANIDKKLSNGVLEYGRISYKKQNKFKYETQKDKLPFIKQLRYKGEKEFRIVWTGEKEEKEGASIYIEPKSIERIIISGDIKEELAKSLKDVIYTIAKDTFDGKVLYSWLYDNKVWKKRINP
ncbi:MAG: hypothetical protein LBC64_06055 [Fibromonadaceae bacterium]|jgi:hypothetical protein|nr:hypothetical protein [Fibromonadaceae bacterium]